MPPFTHLATRRGPLALLILLAAALAALIAASPSHAALPGVGIIFDGSPGTSAPPANLGPYAMLGFAPDATPVFDDVTSVDAPNGGPITFSAPLNHRQVTNGWATWSNGYLGDVYTGTASSPLTIGLPASTGAFYLYAEPDNFGTYTITATANDGTTSGPQMVEGSAGARYYGFYAVGGASLTSITITAAAAAGGFAIGEFGISHNDIATTTTASAAYYDWAPVPTVAISAVSGDLYYDLGFTEFYNGSTLLCTVPEQVNHATCEAAIEPSPGPLHNLTAVWSGGENYNGSYATTDVVPTLAQPVIVSVTGVMPHDGTAWLVKGGGFSGASSVTVCDVPVPFTIINDNVLLIGVPTLNAPQQCGITIVAAGGTGSLDGTATVVPQPQPGASVVVYPGGSSSTPDTPAASTTAMQSSSSCTTTPVALTGQWTLAAWPGADESVAHALEGGGCGASVSSQVSVIWGFDAATQTFQAYFPGAANVPGANDLATLTQGAGYWIGLSDPSSTLTWTVGS